MDIEEYRTRLLNDFAPKIDMNFSPDEVNTKIRSHIKTNNFNETDINYLLEIEYCDCPNDESIIRNVLIEIKKEFNK